MGPHLVKELRKSEQYKALKLQITEEYFRFYFNVLLPIGPILSPMLHSACAGERSARYGGMWEVSRLSFLALYYRPSHALFGAAYN